MAKSKFFGYLVAIIGLAGLAISTEKVLKTIPFLSQIPPNYIVIASVILVGVGIILAMSGSSGKTKLGKEVPIYRGKEIVGYRVLK